MKASKPKAPPDAPAPAPAPAPPRPQRAVIRHLRRALHPALVDVVVLVALKALMGAFVRRCGFEQVSDDDYARTVIAQLFAHSPRWDPSGTSWLPLPFWIRRAAR